MSSNHGLLALVEKIETIGQMSLNRPGPTLDEVAETLGMLVASRSFAGMTITEINPEHLPDPELLHDFCGTLAFALALRSSHRVE